MTESRGAATSLHCYECGTEWDQPLTETLNVPVCPKCGHIGDREVSIEYPAGVLAGRLATLSYYFGSGTRRHEVSHMTDNWATMWCGIGGRTSGPAVKVRSSRVEPNCRACARAKARYLANA